MAPFLKKAFGSENYNARPFRDTLFFTRDSVLIYNASFGQKYHPYSISASGNDLTFTARDSIKWNRVMPRLENILKQVIDNYSIDNIYEGQPFAKVHRLNVIKAILQKDEIIIPKVSYHFIMAIPEGQEDLEAFGSSEYGTLKAEINPGLFPGDTLVLLPYKLHYKLQ